MADTPEKPPAEGSGKDRPAGKGEAAKPPAPPRTVPRMTPEEEKLRREVPSAALDALRERFPDAVLEAVCYADEVTALVPRERVQEILRFLHDDPRTAFDLLADQTAADWPDRERRFDVIYHLYSIPRNHRLRLKCHVGEGEAVATATAIYHAANWHEREIFDLFGIHFEGHPDLRRILLPDEWRGHPLRKEYPLEGFPEQHIRLR